MAESETSVGRRGSEVSHTDVSLRGPAYLESSHAHHTWDLSLQKNACSTVSEATSVWVRFPSPAPLFVVGRVPTLS